MSEFSDQAFVAGSLTGIRTFRVDKLGRLTAVNYPAPVWTPGENVAECKKGDGFVLNITGGMMSFTYPARYSYIYDEPLTFTADPKAAVDAPKEPEPKPEHHVAQLDCTCGYYAYFDNGSNPNHRRGQDIYGIIEGYGRATVGTRGFRCEKAVIKALIIKPKHAERFTRVAANYAGVAVFPSRTDALAAFPLVGPDPLTPENTPDFWTRPA